ncbi:MAG TPA: NADP-dependent oxidoreductase [Xanthomonadales bacterium]|nr:NADP-dependent oxidoreductase [Xanthomonadales bacterium]
MSTATTNRQFRLAARPVGMPKRSDWELTTEAVPEPAEGQVLVQVLYLSLDPAMRGWMNEGRSYIPPVGIGEVMRASGAGRVVKSRHPGFAAEDYVTGILGIQEYAVLNGDTLTKVDPSVPLPVYVSVLGLTGMTAYFGLLDVGKPEAGQTVVVSGAAGAVGTIVGQIAKIKGCRVVGIAGGPEKCRFLVDELGFDAAVDYKSENVAKSLRAHCPKGIDVFFDNVGGDVLDACLVNLARRARIVLCCAISQYNATAGVKGPSNYMMLLVTRSRMEGFVVFDYANRYAEGARQLAEWLKEGSLKSREDIVKGFETFPETLLKLFAGENVGKLILEVGAGE